MPCTMSLEKRVGIAEWPPGSRQGSDSHPDPGQPQSSRCGGSATSAHHSLSADGCRGQPYRDRDGDHRSSRKDCSERGEQRVSLPASGSFAGDCGQDPGQCDVVKPLRSRPAGSVGQEGAHSDQCDERCELTPVGAAPPDRQPCDHEGEARERVHRLGEEALAYSLTVGATELDGHLARLSTIRRCCRGRLRPGGSTGRQRFRFSLNSCARHVPHHGAEARSGRPSPLAEPGRAHDQEGDDETSNGEWVSCHEVCESGRQPVDEPHQAALTESACTSG